MPGLTTVILDYQRLAGWQ